MTHSVLFALLLNAPDVFHDCDYKQYSLSPSGLTQELSATCHFLSKNLCPLLSDSECVALLCRRKSFAGYDDSSNGRFKRRMLHLAISADTISILPVRFPPPSLTQHEA